MEHWEFLLQKEGDRSWLPLDAPDVEILEGRYRIVARSSHSHAAIETRITHVATEAMPPKRRVQKRSCETNQDGLMVVIPFTRLEPGLWELQCSPADLLTDLMAGAQPHAVTLQVVARESEEDWEPDWTTPADVATATTQAFDFPTETATDSVANALPEEALGEALSEPALSEPALSEATVERSPAVGSPAVEQPLLPTNDRPSVMPPEVAEILGASMDRLFQIAEQMSEQLVDEVLQDFDLTAIADAAPIHAVKRIDAVKSSDRAATASTVATSVATTPSRSPLQPDGLTTYTLAVGEAFRLTLDQAAFLVARGETITLSGQVAIVPHPAVPSSGATTSFTSRTEPAIDPANIDPANIDPANINAADIDPWDEAALNLTGATAQALQLCLRDPQSLQVLVSDRQPLPASGFPFSFTFSFSLPDTFSTHLVLGEVLLCGSLAGTEDAIALITQAFSITVDPTALIGELTKLHEALTTDIAEDERLDLPLELSSRLQEASPALDLSFLTLTAIEPPHQRSSHFPSLAGQPLPPQLYRPDPEQASAKPLDLPAFKLVNQTPPAAIQAEDETLESEPAVADAIAFTTAEGEVTTDEAEVAAVNPSEAAPVASTLAETEALDSLTVVVPTDAAMAPDRTADSSDLPVPSPSHMAFQSLKLQDRFLTRLTSLATDTELSALLKANLMPGSMPSSASTAPSTADARSLTEEIVVDDEPPMERYPPGLTTPASTVASIVDAPNPLVLPADDPVPMPTLEMTTGELTAGKPLTIRVKLPNLLPRIYVKLWISDRQTRSLLDGPRWVVNFLPNGLGDLEAMTPLTVPFGSVEIRLEAIAVEMHTQRESHKVTVDRTVVPPDLPIVSLDDFDS